MPFGWFGPPKGYQYEQDSEPVLTPAGDKCRRCGEPIEAGDKGFILPVLGGGPAASDALHENCYLRTIFGGVNHQLGRCRCPGCAGTAEPDPEDLTPRQAADAAVQLWRSKENAR